MEQAKTLRPGELLCELLGEDYETVVAEMEQPKTKSVEQRLVELALRKNVRPTVRDLPVEDLKAYNREAKRKSREARKERAQSGSLDASPEAIREALADAALMILASGAPGAEQVRHALALAFPGKVGVPVTVEAKAKMGKLRPKLIKVG
jgi:hypothetical protein